MYLQKGKRTVAGKKVESVSAKVAGKKLVEKSARAEKAAGIWDKSPLFEGKISKIENAHVRQNVALGLTNQARFIKGLHEAEISTEFQRMAPTNVMRLITYTMTNSNRGNVFTEMTMETTNDAIYTMKSYIAKPWAGDEDFYNKSPRTYPEKDPFALTRDSKTGRRPINSNNNEFETATKRDIYTLKEALLVNELAIGVKVTAQTKLPEGVEVPNMSDGNAADIVFSFDGRLEGNSIFEFGYIPGYAQIYYGKDPNNTVAKQDSTTYKFWAGQGFDGIKVEEIGSFLLVRLPETLPEGVTADDIDAYARYATETDFAGKTLPNMELLMDKHTLNPQRTSMGVSWTTLAEITLGATFHQQIDEVLLESASDAIVAQKDIIAFQEAYQLARTNPATYTVRFNAAYTGTAKVGETTVFAKDGYQDNAQTLSAAIDIASSAIYEDRYRGEVNNLIVGLDVAPYLRLNAGFSSKGKQDAVGVYRIGELDGIPVYKAPIEVLPKNEILATFKNNKVENDVSIIYATLVPFVSKKLEYPTFHTQVGIASYGDRVILNRAYLARIIVDGLKDVYNAVA
jgi:hypothetical protein